VSNSNHHLAMSVVIVTPDNYATIRKTMKHLRAQTVREQLEIVIVAPSAETLDLDDAELAPFFQYCVVEVGVVRSIGEGNATGVQHANAPLVSLLEDHSYPDPRWAEAIIEAHRAPWAAVGPVIGNPNPKSAVGWVDFLLAFSTWSIPTPSRIIDHLPTHNSTYKRAVLQEYGPELATLLKSEIVLNWDMQARGYQLYLESKAKVYHLNFERLSALLQVQFYAGRVFASVRTKKWSFLKRFVYFCGGPLIPLVRSRYVLGQLRVRGQLKSVPLGFYPALVLGLAVSAFGEMLGFSLGPGNASTRLCEFEFHRERHLVKRRQRVS
jgi:GT2 family glycosyltransferase